MKSSLRVVVSGLIAQHPRLGGVTWDYVQYLTGLTRCGYDVFYIEDSGAWPYRFPDEDQDTGGGPNARYLQRVMERFKMKDRWAYRAGSDKCWYGMPDAKRREVVRTADLLINVSGSLRRPRDYRRIPRLAYIDSDPVFTQIKAFQSARMRARLNAHDVHFSFGECLPQAGVPVTPYCWIPTRTPIQLEEWPNSRQHRDVYTTVMSWTSYHPLRYNGCSYGQKDVEFRRFIEVPRNAAVMLEVATHAFVRRRWEIHPGEGRAEDPVSLLKRNGWRLVDSLKRAKNLDSYRDYISGSKAEWSVAKHGYVAGRPGWFSCRSACYLAAGRPVIVQDTGFRSVIPAGEGVLAFRTMAEAVDGIRRVESDYARHSRAAREIAAEYFRAESIVAKLVEDAFSSSIKQRTSGASR
jgi:hypothetical protein